MTTLQALAFNVAAGTAIGCLSLLGFGVAVVHQHEYVAPRCAARPKEVIYNPRSSEPQHKSPLLGWIPWVLSLSYDTMLKGVPGTGTRQGGKTGTLLRLNLDAIVLLRFHAMALKIAAFCTLLCMGVLFPLYWTSDCHDPPNDTSSWSSACASNAYNLTSYERTTIANVPSFLDLQATAEDGAIVAAPDNNPNAESRTLLRLYVAVICFSWIVTWYVLHLLQREWVEILAMRRVYFLEADVWGERRKQLQQQMFLEHSNPHPPPPLAINHHRNPTTEGRLSMEHLGDTHQKSKNRNGHPSSVELEHDEKHLINRQPWIPHPEQQETVSNVALYSVLVGGLPSLPNYSGRKPPKKNNDEDLLYTSRDSMDWQLQLTTAFFDHCVPNQPGFSSSVAAVTILPSSRSIALAWSKWYRAAGKLRRLRFIRAQIAKKLHYEIEDFKDDEVEVENANNTPDHAAPEEKSETSSTRFGRRRKQNDAVELEVPHSAGSISEDDDDTEAGIVRRRAKSKQLLTSNSNGSNHSNQSRGGICPMGTDEDSLPSTNAGSSIQSHSQFSPYGIGNGIGNLYGFFGYSSSSPRHHQSRQSLQSVPMVSPSNLSQSSSMKGTVPGDEEEDGDGINSPRHAALRIYANEEEQQHHDFSKNDSQSPYTPPSIDPNQYYSNSYEHDYSPRSLEQRDEEELQAMTNTFGPEQTAIYSREFAQSAAACCPNGCWEGAVIDSSIDELMEMEREVAAEVHLANLELWKARRLAAQSSLPTTEEPTTHDVGAGTSSLAPLQHHFDPETLRNAEEEKKNNDDNDDDGSESEHVVVFEPMRQQPRRVSLDQTETPLRSNKQQSSIRRVISSESLASVSSRNHGKSDIESNVSSFVSPSLDFRAPPGSVGNHRTSRTPFVNREKLPSDLALEADLYGKATKSFEFPKKGSNDSFHPGPVELEYNGPVDVDNVDVELVSVGGSSQDGRSGGMKRDESSESLGDILNPLAADNLNPPKKMSKWDKVQNIVSTTARATNSANRPLGKGSSRLEAFTGEWSLPTPRGVWNATRKYLSRAGECTIHVTKQSKDAMDLNRESTYAVVTFTSRQAAVAARHCLADGRGNERWMTEADLPIPPLADAAACKCLCRNCCRPVTLTIDNRHKNWRHYCALMLLGAFYVFSAFPLALVSQLIEPQSLKEVFPRFFEWAEARNQGFAELVSAFVQSMLWTIFFALCPVFFRSIANVGSKASSVANAELKSLHYFWWFMVVTAFSGVTIANMFLFGFNDGKVGGELRTVLRSIARAIPATTAYTWLNWIIFRTTVSMPALYLLQINGFLWELFGCNCCSRLSRGGGPGPATPFRLYVDSGCVLMCMLALASASPLVAPAALVYFLLCQPLLRRLCILVYRPKFDGGGIRWPFIFDMVISSLFVGQILVCIQMVLKQASGPAIAAAAPMFPTLLSVLNMKKRYMRSFRDAALMQTSLLDGWDSSKATSEEQREEFRRFLVDAHKAAYVPVCLAGQTNDKEATLTAEPAVVVPQETDPIRYDIPVPDDTPRSNGLEDQEQGSSRMPSDADLRVLLERRTSQRGSIVRRAARSIDVMRQRSPSAGRFSNFVDLETEHSTTSFGTLRDRPSASHSSNSNNLKEQ